MSHNQRHYGSIYKRFASLSGEIFVTSPSQTQFSDTKVANSLSDVTAVKSLESTCFSFCRQLKKIQPQPVVATCMLSSSLSTLSAVVSEALLMMLALGAGVVHHPL